MEAIAKNISLNISSPEAAINEYEKLVRPARERFSQSPSIFGMINPETDAETMAAFLLHFSTLSIPITEPVEGWIRLAGDGCAAFGLSEIARCLILPS
jgi:hypothetical protein